MDNIALAFSGGGFRAACFSLGTLSYLNHLKYEGKSVLKDVKYISSTSGGSITNLVYSSFVFRDKSFDECYAYLKQEMDGEKLIRRALEIMHHGKLWKERPAKSRNLINAFSMAYDELLEREMFSLFEDRSKQPHLEEICVNSTEFTNGLPFRFQSKPPAPLSEGRIGNKFIFIKKSGYEQSGKLKLSDILASSSCFPSGFEPLIFPEDYTHQGLDSEDLRNAVSYTANRLHFLQMMMKHLKRFQALSRVIMIHTIVMIYSVISILLKRYDSG
jgi:Patatin-like phospholipase